MKKYSKIFGNPDRFTFLENIRHSGDDSSQPRYKKEKGVLKRVSLFRGKR